MAIKRIKILGTVLLCFNFPWILDAEANDNVYQGVSMTSNVVLFFVISCRIDHICAIF
jgi:hypothetical protein